MRLAGRYAYAEREAVARHVVREILGAKIMEEVHNHHNFAWREDHGGEEFWVVRKGATPAFPANAALSAAAWAMKRSSSKESTRVNRVRPFTRPSMGLVGSCRAQRPKVNSRGWGASGFGATVWCVMMR